MANKAMSAGSSSSSAGAPQSYVRMQTIKLSRAQLDCLQLKNKGARIPSASSQQPQPPSNDKR